MQVLTKPFVMETLASRIREMIESKVSPLGVEAVP
jgi:hypothetical protein